MKRIEDELDRIYREDQLKLEELIHSMRQEAEIAKTEILANQIKVPENFNDSNIRISYVSDFIGTIQKVALFSDDEILSKLREYRFSNQVIKWFTPLEEILDELERLRNLNGFLFFKKGFFMAATYYIETKVVVAMIESFDLQVKHSHNEESNILYKSFDNFFRKRKYNQNKGQMGKQDYFNLLMNKMITGYELQIKKLEPDFRDLKKIILSSAGGEFHLTRDLLSMFEVYDMKQSEVYLELFPLLKLIFKDKQLYSEEEFNELPELIYNGNYRLYKIKRVKKLLKSC